MGSERSKTTCLPFSSLSFPSGGVECSVLLPLRRVPEPQFTPPGMGWAQDSGHRGNPSSVPQFPLQPSAQGRAPALCPRILLEWEGVALPGRPP